MCCFIVKNLSRVVGQRLPSRCQTHAVEGASFLCPCNQPDSVRSLGRFNILSFVLSMLQNTSKNDFDVRFFSPVSLPLELLPPFVTIPHVNEFAFQSSSGFVCSLDRSHNQLLILELHLHSAPISLPALPLFNSL